MDRHPPERIVSLRELLAVSTELLLELIGSTQAFAALIDIQHGSSAPLDDNQRELLRLYGLIERSRAAIRAVTEALEQPLVLH